jgi:hypothetical protein
VIISALLVLGGVITGVVYLIKWLAH